MTSPSTVARYRKRPVVIEAVQWRGDNFEEVANFLGWEHLPFLTGSNSFSISTLEGAMKVQLFDWIIKGVKGEFYPCRDDIFRQTYEVADGD